MDEEIDRLYELPLGEFVAARNALAKAAKAAGDREGAAAVAALKKPSVTAWALNQVARAHPAEVEALVAAVDALRDASAGAVSGRGSAPMREARDAERSAVRTLVERARSALEAGGHAAGDPQLQRVGDALRAAAGSEEGRAALQAGRLSEEPVADLDDLSALLGSSVGEAPPPRSAEERKADERAALEAEAARLEAAAAAADKEASRLERRADAAELQAESARDEAPRARNAAAAAAARADEAAQRLKRL